MSTVARLLHVLRRGPRKPRLQAFVGLVLIAAAVVWLILHLWQILVLFAGFLVGIYLVVRALRGAPPPPPSSSA